MADLEMWKAYCIIMLHGTTLNTAIILQDLHFNFVYFLKPEYLGRTIATFPTQYFVNGDARKVYKLRNT